MHRYLILAAASCITLIGCMATPQVQAYRLYPPTKHVDVYQTQKPNQPYEEIGRIEVADDDDAYCFDQIRLEARRMGADGVIIVGRSGSVATAVPIGTAAAAVAGEYGWVGIAIKYKDQPHLPHLESAN